MLLDSIVSTVLIAAHRATKYKIGKRDAEKEQTKKGIQCCFGIKL